MSRRISSEMILRGLFALALLLLAGWVVQHTRWEWEDEPLPDRGKAATDKLYSLRRLAAAGGVAFSEHANLDQLPPADGTLWLDSPFWAVFPERKAQLRHWVEQGGHLVLTASRIDQDELQDWIPLRHRAPPRAARPAASAGSAAPAPAVDDEEDDDDTVDTPVPGARPASGVALSPAAGPAQDGRRCENVAETAGTPLPAFAPRTQFHHCLPAYLHLHRASPGPVLWGLGEPERALMLRVPVGRGSVAATSWWRLPDNQQLLQEDHALMVAALFDFHAGQQVWVVGTEARMPLRTWLWTHARTPLLLALAALVLALWRLAPRFGPRVAAAPPARRSMGEQVRGTADFIAAHEPAALHAAARRAFDATLRRHLVGFDAMSPAERIEALAAHLPIDTRKLLEALAPGPASTPTQWLAAISLLEQTRRALVRLSGLPDAR